MTVLNPVSIFICYFNLCITYYDFPAKTDSKANFITIVSHPKSFRPFIIFDPLYHVGPYTRLRQLVLKLFRYYSN